MSDSMGPRDFSSQATSEGTSSVSGTQESFVSASQASIPSAHTLLSHSQAIEVMARVLETSGLTEMEYACGDLQIRLSRQVQPVPAPAMPVYAHGYGFPGSGGAPSGGALSQAVTPSCEPVSAGAAPQGTAVTSPLVGTAYLAPKPGADPFVRVGDSVQEGQTLMIIEAMKVMNPIKSTVAGKVLEVCVSNGAPVEYDEVLVRIG